MTTDVHDQLVFWASVQVFTALSAICSFAIIYAILKKYKNDFCAHLVGYLSVADFCLSIVCLAICADNLARGHIDPNSISCLIQPVITWYFMEASILWLTVIACYSCKCIFSNNKVLTPLSTRIEIILNLICWGLPLITVMIPLSSASGEYYGPRNGLWCSFAVSQKGAQLVNILVYYSPCLVIIASCYIAIVIRIYRLRKLTLEYTNSREIIDVIGKLLLFPVAYFVVWTPLTICYIYEYSTGQFVSFTAEYISDNLMHVQGWINWIIYGGQVMLLSLLLVFRDIILFVRRGCRKSPRIYLTPITQISSEEQLVPPSISLSEYKITIS